MQNNLNFTTLDLNRLDDFAAKEIYDFYNFLLTKYKRPVKQKKQKAGFIDNLLENPVSITGFKPLTRNELYES